MSKRWWHVMLLAGSVVIFASVAVVITRQVVDRRSGRDIAFGLEELDVLISDGLLDEARAMVPWLTERARTAGSGLRILKRARELSEASGEWGAFANAAERLSTEFSGNMVLREVAVYARAGNGDFETAQQHAQVLLEQTGNDLYYSWLLLRPDRDGPPIDTGTAAETTDPGDSVLLSVLSRDSGPEQFAAAWQATGRWEYAHLAALLAVADGNPQRAVELVRDASLDRLSPLLAYDVYVAAGELASAREVINEADPTDIAVSMRRADLALYRARPERASELYSELYREQSDSLPYHAFINLAWSVDDDSQRQELFEEALERFPGQWEVVEQAARHLSATDTDRALSLVRSFQGPRDHGESLLELLIEADPLRRGFEASIWQLVEIDRSTEALRYAAWYFFEGPELESILARSEEETWWRQNYRGVLSARTGDWDGALEHFNRSFREFATAPAAYNGAIAHVRRGYLGEAADRLGDALLLSPATPRLEVAALIALSRLERDRATALGFLERALAVDPGNTEALLRAQQLRTRNQ